MATIYQVENQVYSDKCHELAKTLVYPKLFSVAPESIRYEQNTLLNQSERGKILDGEMGVDRIVHCKVEGIFGETSFTIQERFRRPEFYRYQDLTVTEWNHATNRPSELSKINAGIFVYGYGNSNVADLLTDFIEVVAVNTTSLLYLLTTKNISYDRRPNKKQQTFLAFKLTELSKRNSIMFRYVGILDEANF